MNEHERDDKDQLWSEATLWFARMRSPDAEAFRREFEAWLGRGALHRRYYNRAAEYWVDSGTALSGEDDHDAVRSPEQSPPGNRPRRRAVAALAAASLFVASSAILLVPHYHGSGNPAGPPAIPTQGTIASLQFATAAGEQRWIRLADGSAVLLGSGTRLRVRFGTTIRRLELDRGKARFEVAHEARPFVVFAGGGSVTAHGTVFEVGVGPDHRVSVRLIKGSIDVQLPQATSAAARLAPRRLRPGEAITFKAADAPVRSPAPPSPAPLRSQAARDYDNVRLSDIVAEANRGAAVPIRIADPSVAGQRVSGRFTTDDAPVLADRLAALFDLVADRSNRAEIVLRPK